MEVHSAGQPVCPPEPKIPLWGDWLCILGQMSEASVARLIMEYKLVWSAAVYRSLGGPVLHSTGTFSFWKGFCNLKDGLCWLEVGTAGEVSEYWCKCLINPKYSL